MRVAIMQPYFFPYLGYFQLLNAADTFVVYDNIEYTKKGWINRNAIVSSGQKTTITLNVAAASDWTLISDRRISDEFHRSRNKILRQIESSYGKLPAFAEAYPVVRQCLLFETESLFEFLWNSIDAISEYLGIKTEKVKSSTLPVDHGLRHKYRVWDICRHLGAATYLNPEGGRTLYSRDEFRDEGIKLEFLTMNEVIYDQPSKVFLPRLSIIDVMMSVPRSEISQLLTKCSID